MRTLRRWPLWLAPACLVVLTAAAQQPWKNKQSAAWTAADARRVLTDSPWAKSLTPKMEQRAPRDSGMGRNGGMNRGGGIGMGGGMGGSRRGGIGGGIGGNQNPQRIPDGTRSNPFPDRKNPRQAAARKPPTLTVRWESALPVREAASKTRDAGAVYGDESHYAVAVLRVPARMVSSGKPKAELKRKGKKTIKSSGVEIVPQGNSRMVVFLFPKGKQEITADDKQVEFNTRIGPLELKQPFEPGEMTYDGKLRL